MRRQMSGFQRAELLSGLAACAVGLLALGVVLFAPLASSMSGSTYQSFYLSSTRPEAQGTSSLAQSLQSGIWLYPLIIVVCLIIVALSAALHSHGGKTCWRVTLWAATTCLLGLLLLGLNSIGIFLAPAWLLALGATCLSLSEPSPTATLP